LGGGVKSRIGKEGGVNTGDALFGGAGSKTKKMGKAKGLKGGNEN